ncbi:MAG: hypothetical protein QF923_04855, partial [Candidatus Marinimicrobia bacterium]|nr:hypothetical protein [Candidatus Neomarinimicrobiota bacterium]
MRKLILITIALVIFTLPAFGQEEELSIVVTASDHNWDGGDKIDLEWELPQDIGENVATFKIYRSNTTDEINAIIKDIKSKAVKDAKEAVTKRLIENAEKEGVSKNDKGLLQRIRDERK